MSDWPVATRRDHLRFCKVEGWTEVRNARGDTGSRHITLELALPGGEVLRTRVSHPPDRRDYGKGLWARILRDQLQVTESQFWTAVRDGVLPDRSSSRDRSGGGLPVDVAKLLRDRVGLAESEIAAITRDEAIQRLNRYWTEGA